MPSKDCQLFTYQTRLKLDEAPENVLDQCADLLSQVERCLFADISAGKESTDLKSHYLKQYQITARHFNALRVQLEGKISSIKEKQKLQIVETNHKIETLQNRIAKLEKKNSSNVLHQKRRLLAKLQLKLKQLKSDREEGKVHLCFGSKRLFRAQFDLVSNGYGSHEEWLAVWKKERKNSFFLLGSKDETSGNQSCTATIAEDGTLTLRIRLPDSLGKYLVIPKVHFKYGHQEIVAALKSCAERKRLKSVKNSQYKEHGLAISYRFKRDAKSWKVFISVPVAKAPQVTSDQQGVIGLDINANHLALTETDRFGNPIKKSTIKVNTYGKNRQQTQALIGKTCASIIDYAKTAKKTLVIENLDFQKKKMALKENFNPAHARMLSGFAYSSMKHFLTLRAWKEGVQIEEVNPAYTSIIGRVKFSKRYGLSIHHSAALSIGRRYLRFSERIPRHLGAIPDGKGCHVALSLPVRNRDKHVWVGWGKINQELKTVLAAHFRTGKNRSSRSKTSPEIIPKFCRRNSDT